MIKISNNSFVLMTTLLYAGFIIFISSFHVVWRNEVVPMTVASQSTSLMDLFSKIHSFGHPFLWYFLLYLVHQVIHPYWVLKLVNLSICIAAIFIFLANAPFSRLVKVLFVLGFFPLYLYPVINCNYGISMLLLFAFAAVYPQRFEKIILLGFILFLLACAHAHSLITVMGISLALMAELIFSPSSRQAWQVNLNRTILGFAIILGGILLSAFLTIPDHDNIILDPHPLGHQVVIMAFIKSLILPGKAFSSVLGFPSALFPSAAVLFIYAYFLNRPYLLIFFAMGVVGLSIFYHLIFFSDEMRHQGALYLLIITVFWLESYQPTVKLGKISGRIQKFVAPYSQAFLIFLLVLQIGMSLAAIKKEMTTVYSSSKSLGILINHNPIYKKAVLIGEPGAMVEALPYYSDNTIYLPREGSFNKYTQFNKNQKSQYCMTDLLKVSHVIKTMTGKPVLIIMGHKLSLNGPYQVKFSHGRSFTYTRESLVNFYAQTIKVASFDKAVTDENYGVYLLK